MRFTYRMFRTKRRPWLLALEDNIFMMDYFFTKMSMNL